jgi:hypothetical protein
MLKHHKQNLYQNFIIYRNSKGLTIKFPWPALVCLALRPTSKLTDLIGLSTCFTDGPVNDLHSPVVYSLHDSMHKACGPTNDPTRRQPIWRLLSIPNRRHGTVATATASAPPRDSTIMSLCSLRAATIIGHRFPIRWLMVVASSV